MAFKVKFSEVKFSDAADVEYTDDDRWKVGDSGALTVDQADGTSTTYAPHAWDLVQEWRDPNSPMVFGT
jgi:hypothetical protein